MAPQVLALPVEKIQNIQAEFLMWYRESLQRLTPLRAVVSIALLCSMCVYAAAFHIISCAANTPERAASASPRTLWSCKGRAGQMSKWYEFQQQLANEAARYTPASPYDARTRLVLFGDSITEAWRGTAYGEPSDAAAGVPNILEASLSKRWPSPLVFGISGDQTQHLLWRLEHGEISAKMAEDHRLLAVLMIGTNNLASGHAPEEVVEGVEAITSRLLNKTRGRVLVNALLPRGDGMRRLPALCPPSCGKNGKPLRSFRSLTEKVNALLGRLTNRLSDRNPERVRFVDCGRVFDPSADDSGSSGGGVGVGGGVGSMASAPGNEASVAAVHGAALGLITGVGEAVSHPTTVLAKTERAFFAASEKATAAAEEYLIKGAGAAGDVRLDLMPDRLHPNAEGHRLLANCIELEIHRWQDVGGAVL